MSQEGNSKVRACGQMVVNELLAETQPEYRDRRLEAERQTREAIESGEASRVTGELITIPVVVHIVLEEGEGEISDEQVESQIEVLNRDYRAENPDVESVPAVWAGLVTDSNIQFALAEEDPEGESTSGITRTLTENASFDLDNRVKAASTGGTDPWPTDRYLNLWVCDLGDRLLGYAQFPNGPSSTDGVVIHMRAFGTSGTAEEPFNGGRTATHEVGHFLGLRHIWGDKNDCSGDDMIADTPSAERPNTGKPSFPHVTCNNAPSGDMFMNYMDYVDDDSMFMFTAAQVARMNATLAGPRRSLAGL
ncbi:MAG: zinc metalloprotease [Solirubrobacterales bacterium]